MANLRAWNPWLRYPVLLMVNVLPMVVGIFLFRLGAAWNVVFFPLIMLTISYLNYRSCGIGGFCCLQVVLALCTMLMGCVSTYLYTSRISNDDMSYVLGEGLTLMGVNAVVIALIVGVILKIRHCRKNEQSTPSPELER